MKRPTSAQPDGCKGIPTDLGVDPPGTWKRAPPCPGPTARSGTDRRSFHAAPYQTAGGPEDWERLAEEIPSFPDGKDGWLERHWITSAVDVGSAASVEWMVKREVPLRFRDDEGYTILHSCIDREDDDRHDLLELLIDAGADVNLKGTNDWTPLHMAGARGDLEAIRILMENGADPSIRTDIDSYATPAEEAASLGQKAAARLIRALTE